MSAKKTSGEDLLIDRLYRQTFKTGEARLRETLRLARRFVLDDQMSAFLVDLTYEAFHGHKWRTWKQLHRRLDEARHFARLPHKITWVEHSHYASVKRFGEIAERDKAKIERRGDTVWNPISADSAKGVRIGWLLVQHERIDNAFTLTKFLGEPSDERIRFAPAAPSWVTEENPNPWNLHPPEREFRGLMTGSEFVTTIHGYQRPNCGYRIMGAEYDGSEVAEREVQDAMREQAGTLRYVWIFFSTLNKIPAVGEVEHRAAHGFIARGKYHPFLQHQVITLHIPEKKARIVAKSVVCELLRRRAHMVRGFWRDDWRLPKGNKEIWVAEHARGDASLGWVEHSYSVTHEADKK